MIKFKCKDFLLKESASSKPRAHIQSMK